ncbi:MAG: hypothetical protein OEY51_06825 [Cyclobacteriaceae bacterium]|nr:hypothetical protein [Cyclobacteriaceae bacterium]
MNTKNIFLLFVITVLLSACGKKITKAPIDDIIRDIPSGRVFTVILYDMDVQGSIFNDYFHQYKIIEEIDSIPEERITEWLEVGEDYFTEHQNDMGMEIAHRGEDGKLEKKVAPPGYNRYVGNSHYGHWNSNGIWAFYGQYMFMSSMLNMGRYPVQRGYYDDYRTNYYGSGRAYYGPTTGGRSYYGTGSAYAGSYKPNSSWSSNTSSFKQRVGDRTTRSSSRYGGTSSRSRGGGSGK